MRLAVHAGALVPLAAIIWAFAHGTLSANPIEDIQLRTGSAAIDLLMLSLFCTPVFILTGFRQVMVLRRPLGLWAFFYVVLHFFNFLGVDYQFNLGYIEQDLFEKRYAIVGFASFVLLLPLAITSLNSLRRRMGRNWQRLHWLVYPAAVLAVIHFIWQARVNIRGPIMQVKSFCPMQQNRCPLHPMVQLEVP